MSSSLLCCDTASFNQDESVDTTMTYDQFVDLLIEQLRRQRLELGLTQTQLGERIGKQQTVIARFESGTVRDPRLSMFFDICQGLEIDPAQLLQLNRAVEEKSNKTKIATEKIRVLRSKMKQLSKSTREELALIEEMLQLL